MQRNKGHGYEREIVRELRAALGVETSRNLTQSRDGGYDIPVGKFLLESKRYRRIAVEKWLKQCEAACYKAQQNQLPIPVVVMRQDGGESMILMRAKDFWPLMGNELPAEKTK